MPDVVPLTSPQDEVEDKMLGALIDTYQQTHIIHEAITPLLPGQRRPRQVPEVDLDKLNPAWPEVTAKIDRYLTSASRADIPRRRRNDRPDTEKGKPWARWLQRMPRVRRGWLLAATTVTVGSLLAPPPGLSAAEIVGGPPTSMHQLVWSDEFNGSSLDSSKWTAQEGYRDPDRQYNTKRNVSVSGGTVKLYAKNDGYGTAPYTGGWLVCNYRPKYGYFEARLRMYNQGPGHWGTFWLTGTHSWPPEIDVSENLGNRISTGDGSYQNYIHSEGSSGRFSGVDYRSWHVYGVEWLPGAPLKFYIDGVLKHAAFGPSLTADMHMLLTHGVGTGTWSGKPDSTTPWPGILEVDWVRHWRYTGTNLSVGKPVTASGEQSANPARNAVDGNDSTRWSRCCGFPQWIQVDLGSSKTISMVELAPYLDRAYQYEVNISVDGVNYVRVVDRRSNTRGGPVLTATFRETSARYVRLVVNGISGNTTSWTAIREFRVFGK